MKLIALAAALTFGGTALAQTTPQSTTTTTTTGEAADATPRGGYMPAAPALSGPLQPGQQAVFVPSTLTPDQAFPPPPLLAHYPICKRGQTDHCMQRGGR